MISVQTWKANSFSTLKEFCNNCKQFVNQLEPKEMIDARLVDTTNGSVYASNHMNNAIFERINVSSNGTYGSYIGIQSFRVYAATGDTSVMSVRISSKLGTEFVLQGNDPQASAYSLEVPSYYY